MLRLKLQSFNLSQILAHAENAGINDVEIEVAEDSEDPKGTLIDLILASNGMKQRCPVHSTTTSSTTRPS